MHRISQPGRAFALLSFLLCSAPLLAGVLAKTGMLGWFGNLPGDISFRRGGFRFYFPLTSMILISVILSLLVGLFRRFF